MLLEGTLIEFDHATLMVNSLVMTVHCSRQLIALRVIGNDRRRTAFHIVMMILITSHIPIQGVSSLTRVTVTCHMPLYKVRLNTSRRLIIVNRCLKTVLLLGYSLLSRCQVTARHELHIVRTRLNCMALQLRHHLVGMQ